MFVETEQGLIAYIGEKYFSDDIIRRLDILHSAELRYSFSKKNISYRSWNEEWESNFEPVAVGNELLVRAPFHSAGNHFPIEIVIEPRIDRKSTRLNSS